MGLFSRSKKKDEESKIEEETTPIKSPEEIERERIQNELEFLKN